VNPAGKWQILIVAGAFGWMGCTSAVGSIPFEASFPVRTVADPPDQARKPPTKRLGEFEENYRTFEYCAGLRSNAGCSPLIYPRAVQQGAGWDYVFLGRDFVSAGDPGGAARAYWSALVLSGRSVASRAEKEKLRRAAFLGLRDIARARPQRRWGEMMSLCARLAETYLTTDQAANDDRAFYAEMDQHRSALLAGESARRAASTQYAVAMMGAMGSLNAGMSATAVGNTQLGNQQMMQGMGTLLQASADHDLASAQLRDIQSRQAGAAIAFRGIVAEDVPEIEAGKSFLAETTMFYLLSAQDAEPYLRVLREFAPGKPGVESAFSSEACQASSSPLKNASRPSRRRFAPPQAERESVAGQRQSVRAEELRSSVSKHDRLFQRAARPIAPECVLELGKAMRDIEILVARYERRDVSIPPEAAAQVWPD
jgi:hypothetical protein